MKKYVLTIWILIMVIITASAQNADAILGIWHSPHGNTEIQITKKDNKYFGTTLLLKDSHSNNQPRPDTGIVILKDFKYSEGVYYGGRVLDLKSKRTNNGRMRLINNDRLDVRIFFGIVQFGRTETWTRVTS
jgi:uncharacterized protein (DUF2147 family)